MRKKVQVALLHQDESKQILLLQLKLIPQRGSHWQNVTGHVDLGEDLQSAAIRELKEETGISIKPDQLICTDYQFKFHDRHQQNCHEFGYYTWLPSHYSKQSISLDSKEHTDFKWVVFNKMTQKDFGYLSGWRFIESIAAKLSIALVLSVMLLISPSDAKAADKAYKLRLHPQEKNNIIAAVNSDSKLYILTKNAQVFDLLSNTTHYTIKPKVVSVFNEPTLSGHRYIRTHNKVRYIVDSKNLKQIEKDIVMSPQELEFKRDTRTKPKMYIGAPHETKAP